MNSDIELEIGPDEKPGVFTVEVLRSAAGERLSSPLRLDAADINSRHGELENAVLASAVQRRGAQPSPGEEVSREIGRQLFEAVFTGAVGDAYRASQGAVQQADERLRVELQATSKIRCPLRPGSMTLDRDRPEILFPPEHPPACCTQQTLTVPPDIAAKTRQKHDYPSAAWRRSYTRRTSAERAFATIKDPATATIARGWCRLTGLAPLTLWIACTLTIRNQRILAAWDARQADNTRRAAAGLQPRTRKRRCRITSASPAAAPP